MTTNDPHRHTPDLLDALRAPSPRTAVVSHQQKLKRRLHYHRNRKVIWLSLVSLIVAVAIKPVISPLVGAALNDHNWFVISILLVVIAAIVAIFVSEADASE